MVDGPLEQTYMFKEDFNRTAEYLLRLGFDNVANTELFLDPCLDEIVSVDHFGNAFSYESLPRSSYRYFETDLSSIVDIKKSESPFQIQLDVTYKKRIFFIDRILRNNPSYSVIRYSPNFEDSIAYELRAQNFTMPESIIESLTTAGFKVDPRIDNLYRLTLEPQEVTNEQGEFKYHMPNEYLALTEDQRVAKLFRGGFPRYIPKLTQL